MVIESVIGGYSPPTHTHTIQDSTSSSLVPSDLHHHTAHSSSISSSSSTSVKVDIKITNNDINITAL